MAGTPVDVTTGASILFDSGFFAEVTDINWSGMSRPSIPTSHMLTAAAGAGEVGNATFIPGRIIDPGSLDIEFHYNPDTDPPIAGLAEAVTLAFALFPGDSTPANLTGSAFMMDFAMQGPLDDKMVATATLKWSGPITITAAA